jgi:SAM-dependent methyltransferase
MERAAWLQEQRRLSEERMDARWAPIYDENWGASISPSHRRFMQRFLSLPAPRGVILDAACGTGKYWPMLIEQGHTVIGIDQSQGMLSRARAKFPNVSAEKLGLQEMRYRERFDGVFCMDALELVFPEDWLPVLNNFQRALKPRGYLYCTVELAVAEETENAYLAGQQQGLPVVFGEWAHEGGYHYYPSIEQVKAWLHEAQFALIEEGAGDDYHHFIVRRES